MSAIPSPASRPVVAIAGATGHLGKNIATALLSTLFRDQFSEVILLSRNGSSPTFPGLDARFLVRKYDENNLAEALEGVQVLVNAVGPSGHSFKEKIVEAIPQTDVQLYFPSEFGVDHYLHDFVHSEWDQKKKHFHLTQQLLSPKIRVCRVFCGLFLDDSIGPWFGFNTVNGKYESVGSSDTGISFTSLEDVGKTVASLASLPAESVPKTLHIGGDTHSFSEIASIMEAAGAGRIEVTETPLQKYKAETTRTTSWDPANYLRFLMGEGKINHTVGHLGCDNELVNPKQELWQWRKLTDLAKETKGQPWKDLPWPPQ
ncbi:uncharacterized protein N7511_007757 [Penicillium nucicola]|uniref:uncharacterized protein n=1 Tax=Penicillium nucicola TaxID=1850975 RepID=UPI002544E961|nr:uncharacterized protein N7511_007757 [Penicillium nucicola]KAJ5753604.1 hypothetical protein N7511_007757 [Penicillium nucicola]